MKLSLHNSSRPVAAGIMAFIAFSGAPVRAQVAPVPAGPLTFIIASKDDVLIRLPLIPGANLAGAKLTVAERGGTAFLSDSSARVRGITAGSAEVLVNLQGDPGLYELRLYSGDKKTPLSAAVPVIIPGIRREAGAWRVNGDFVVPLGPDTSPNPANFVEGLSRNGKTKLPVALRTGTPDLSWRALRLPSLDKWQAAPWSVAQAQAEVARLGGNLLGVEFPVGVEAAKMPPLEFAAALKSASEVVRGVAPGAALILEVDCRQPEVAASLLDAAAPLFDVVVLNYPAATETPALWPLKVARRIVEEQKDYDLPVFVRMEGAQSDKRDQFLLDCFIGGATGLIVAPGQEPGWSTKVDPIRPLLERSVTLEDAPIRRDTGSLRLAEILRQSGRIPLLGRLPKDEKSRGESCLVTLNAATTGEDLEAIKRAASAGAVIYMEGTIPGADADILKQLEDLTGTEITPLPKEVANILILDDPWMFGAYSKAQLPVRQSLKLEVRQSMAAQTKNRPGLDALTVPRFTAHLTDSDGGLLEYGVGKGRVVWMPHRFEPGLRGPDLAGYYAAISGTLQAALIRLKPVDGRGVGLLIGLRMSQGKNTVLELLNPGAKPVSASVVARGSAEALLDGSSGEKIEFTTRGNETTFPIEVPANGWRLVIFAANAKDLDKERDAKRWKVKLK